MLRITMDRQTVIYLLVTIFLIVMNCRYTFANEEKLSYFYPKESFYGELVSIRDNNIFTIRDEESKMFTEVILWGTKSHTIDPQLKLEQFAWLENVFLNHRVLVEVIGTDKKGKWLAKIYPSSFSDYSYSKKYQMANLLILHGLVAVDSNICAKNDSIDCKNYLVDESLARNRKEGMWKFQSAHKSFPPFNKIDIDNSKSK